MTTKLKKWLETVDPYYTQRIILRKGIYLSVWLTMINFLLNPRFFSAFAFPVILLTAFYELPSLTTYRKKDFVLVMSFCLTAVGCVLFYLLYPYKFYLFIAVLAYYFAMYWLAYLYFPFFLPCVLTTLLIGALNMMILPQASLQVSIYMFFSVMLGLFISFIALKLHPNLYHHVWYRAIKLYLGCIKVEVGNIIVRHHHSSYAEGLVHLNMLWNVMHLLPRKQLTNRFRLTIQMRNIGLVLAHLYKHEKNDVFWHSFQIQLGKLKNAMDNMRPCEEFQTTVTTDKNEAFAEQNLERAILNWNKLCLAH